MWTFQPLGPLGITKPAGSVSWIARLNAPPGPVPRLVRTSANVTSSPARTPVTLLSMGLFFSPVAVIVPDQRAPLVPGALNVTPAGPAGVFGEPPLGL